MPRVYAISWRPSDELDLRRAVRNANKRRRAAIKRYDGADWLPPVFEYKKIRAGIYSRDDLKRAIKSLTDFTADTAAPVTNQYGVTTSIWQAAETKKKIRRENMQRAQSAQKRSEYVRGKKITTPDEQQKQAEAREIQKGFEDFTDSGDWEKFLEYVDTFTDKKRFYDDPQEYYDKLVEAMDKRGIDDNNIRAFYSAMKNKIVDYSQEGFYFADLKMIYDPAIETDSKIEQINREIVVVIEREGPRTKKKFIEQWKQNANVDGNDELAALWDFLGYERLFDAWKSGLNIEYPGDLYSYIDSDDELKEKWSKKRKRKKG